MSEGPSANKIPRMDKNAVFMLKLKASSGQSILVNRSFLVQNSKYFRENLKKDDGYLNGYTLRGYTFEEVQLLVSIVNGSYDFQSFDSDDIENYFRLIHAFGCEMRKEEGENFFLSRPNLFDTTDSVLAALKLSHVYCLPKVKRQMKKTLQGLSLTMIEKHKDTLGQELTDELTTYCHKQKDLVLKVLKQGMKVCTHECNCPLMKEQELRGASCDVCLEQIHKALLKTAKLVIE